MNPYPDTLLSAARIGARDTFLDDVSRRHTDPARVATGEQAVAALWTALGTLDTNVHIRNEYDRIFMEKLQRVIGGILANLDILDAGILELYPCVDHCPEVRAPTEVDPDPSAPAPRTPVAVANCDAIIEAVQAFHEELAQIIGAITTNLDNPAVGRTMIAEARRLDELNARVAGAVEKMNRQQRAPRKRCAELRPESSRLSAAGGVRGEPVSSSGWVRQPFNSTQSMVFISYVVGGGTAGAQILFGMDTGRKIGAVGLLMRQEQFTLITGKPQSVWQTLLRSKDTTPIPVRKEGVTVNVREVPRDADSAQLYRDTHGNDIFEVGDKGRVHTSSSSGSDDSAGGGGGAAGGGGGRRSAPLFADIPIVGEDDDAPAPKSARRKAATSSRRLKKDSGLLGASGGGRKKRTRRKRGGYTYSRSPGRESPPTKRRRPKTPTRSRSKGSRRRRGHETARSPTRRRRHKHRKHRK